MLKRVQGPSESDSTTEVVRFSGSLQSKRTFQGLELYVNTEAESEQEPIYPRDRAVQPTLTGLPVLPAFSTEPNSRGNGIARHQKLCRYLTAMSEAGWITDDTRRTATSLWYSIYTSARPIPPVPSASVGPDGEVSLQWESGAVSLEAEIYPNGEVLFTFWDADADSGFETPGIENGTIPAQVAGVISRLT